MVWAAAARDEDWGSNAGAGAATDAGAVVVDETVSIEPPVPEDLFVLSPGLRKREENEGGSGESAVAVAEVEASKLGAASESCGWSSQGSATAL